MGWDTARISAGWGCLPAELKVHCLRALPAETILTFAGTGRDTCSAALSEELWADLFFRDWRWLFPGGPREGSTFRQQHLQVTRQARSDHTAFIVLGGSVRRDGVGHADAAVLSSLTVHEGQLQWRSFVLPSPGRCAAGLCHEKGRLYVAGGFDFSAQEATSSVEVIDVPMLLRSEPEVKALPRLRSPRACPGVVTTPDAVLAIGGGSSMFTAAEAFSSVEVLPHCATSSQWRPAPSLLRPRCAAGVCATAAGHVFVVSGYAGDDRYEDTVEWSDAASGEGLLRGWKPAPALAQPRAGCVACFGPEGCVWALGGGLNESESLATVERLDPRAPCWCGDVCLGPNANNLSFFSQFQTTACDHVGHLLKGTWPVPSEKKKLQEESFNSKLLD